MNEHPNISIIICTRNRAESLRQTLESVGKVSVPEGWNAELLVVDNGSTDHTNAVVNAARSSNVKVRHVNEPLPGLSNARNAGLREARGEIILFTDDDVRIPANWIEGMSRPMLNGSADAVCGGVVFPGEIEALLSQPPFLYRRSWFASTEALDPNKPGQMVGANMAFHRRVLERIPKFDVELGAGALGFGEESLFSYQLLAAGYKLIGVFDVPVEHHFDCSRLTREGMLDMARKTGRTYAFLDYHWNHLKLRWVVLELVLWRLRQMRTRCFENFGRSARGYDRAIWEAQKLAYYHEYLVQRRRPFKYSRPGQ
jgi:glycosyltransferase involved in cell wall biosynthesis